ncbi:MAG TPA: transcription elongation factor GreAB [Desulfuromonadales bacterium]|nr:transcription elongation factor GreAB [Desulfuromonadales bacterium]
MDKQELLQLIREQLRLDATIQFNAAKTAHQASTDQENIPDNKYETLALEASYLAQGQANRAQEIRRALESYTQLELHKFDHDGTIALTAVVTLAADDGTQRVLFIGPREGGMKVMYQQAEIVVITPASPLGRALIGKECGDCVTIGSGGSNKEFEIIDVC